MPILCVIRTPDRREVGSTAGRAEPERLRAGRISPAIRLFPRLVSATVWPDVAFPGFERAKHD
jgi:hypothetical protein